MPLSIAQKVKFLKESRYEDLNTWEKEFVDDLYEFVDEDSSEPTSGLTRRQIEKIDEIWADMNL